MRRAAALAAFLPLTIAATTPPAWSPRPTAAAPAVAARTVTVRPGETLGHVALRVRAGAAAIARENGLAPPYRLRPGSTLKVPAGRYHLVREREAGIAVARAYGVPWARILTANGLTDPYQLRAGERLLIPDAARRRTLEERAAAFRLDIDDILTGGEPALSARERPARPARSARRTLPPDAALVQPDKSFAGRFAWPLNGRLLVAFGPQPDGRRSDGIIIAARSRQTVRAAADGVVAYAGRAIPAYGGLVLVRHGGGWITAYGLADALLVKRGQAVKRGQPIARAGTGAGTRVLFQVRRERVAIDPLGALPAAA